MDATFLPRITDYEPPQIWYRVQDAWHGEPGFEKVTVLASTSERLTTRGQSPFLSTFEKTSRRRNYDDDDHFFETWDEVRAWLHECSEHLRDAAEVAVTRAQHMQHLCVRSSQGIDAVTARKP